MILGINITSPAAAAATAANSTPAAARSLTAPMRVSCSGQRKSHSFSTAEFRASAINTSPIHIVIAIHSHRSILSINPAATTSTVATRWIHALCSPRTNSPTPRPAYTKLRSRARRLNFLFITVSVFFIVMLFGERVKSSMTCTALPFVRRSRVEPWRS